MARKLTERQQRFMDALFNDAKGNIKDAKIIAGAKSNEIENLLGYHSRDVIIHRDDMVLKN